MSAPHQGAWQAFDTSTETGRMLKRLYGGRAYQPNIEKPKIITKSANECRTPFVPGGAKLDARNPRLATKRAIKVAAPRHVEQRQKVHAIEVIARRRAANDIARHTADVQMRCHAYRPPAIRGYSTNDEKLKIQEKFQFGGGKCLPKEMTQAPGPLPSQELAKLKEAKRIEHEWCKRRGEKHPSVKHQNSNDLRTELIETITKEIEDRQAYLKQLSDLDKKQPRGTASTKIAGTRRRIDLELALRKNELSRLLPSSS